MGSIAIAEGLPTLEALLALSAAIAVGWLAYRILFRVLRGVARRAGSDLAETILEEMRPGARLLFPAAAARGLTSGLEGLPEVTRGPVQHGLLLLGIGAVTWLAIGAIGAVADFVRKRHDLHVADNLGARRIHTQVDVLERTTEVLIALFGMGAALITFPGVRELGAGLLASAGFVGLAVGLAARPLLENLIAGIQLAITQPIRVDDVVIVHGEWGRIEEITTSYVVVCIWDERRLIVPFASFISQPFENWTRTSADILGTVFLWTDYTVPVAEAREALEAIVRDAPQWDGRVCNVQVVDTTEQAVKLRALVSAADSGRAWELRVHVRERWLDWLQRTHPESLPRGRIALEPAAESRVE